MPSNTSSRTSGSKNSTKTTTSRPNGIGPAAKEPKANTSSANPVSSQYDAATAGKLGRDFAAGNRPASQDIQTAIGELEGLNERIIDGIENAGPTVNRKKQKRRQKQAARLAAEQPSGAGASPSQAYIDASVTAYKDLEYAMSATQAQMAQVKANGYGYGHPGYDDPEYEPGEGEDLYYTDEDDRLLERPYSSMRTNGIPNAQSTGNPSAQAKKKKKNKSNSMSRPGYPAYDPHSRPYTNVPTTQPAPPPPPPPAFSTAALRSAHHMKDRIWNTSTAEERERIKEFWLSLGEEDRRSLVKVEKEAVLKKMKEQQKHSCSCTVCGRKRTAIEEELEVLYDAYYEELEQYANHQQDGAPMIPPPKGYGHPMGRVPPSHPAQGFGNAHSPRGRIQEVQDDEDDGDDEDYEEDDDDEDEDISDGEPEEPMGHATDFFNFGNSLTVQGGILTVADDLLKNDGKKFIEMMEQLAERRMQREEEAQYQNGLRHPSGQPHNHGPPLDDDGEYDEEDEDDYDSQDDEEYEDDEMEAMTEEQRMEEGRRMFQIFAARMFEQRVLTAYREKVARERQQKLIEELDEESRLDTQREAKKAKEAQKKKDKKRQQKQAKDEEKAKREAEKAAEEAELRAVEEKRLEEQRQKKEEQRKKREAEKRAQEEERQRKEAEKQKRLQEAREQQAEQEKKQREQKEREKKKREEAKKKEREAREAKEQEAREKKEREAAERRERESKAKLEKEERDRKRTEEQASKQPTPAPVVPSIPSSMKLGVALPAAPHHSGLAPPQTTSSHASPHLTIATPVVPKAPTPIRPRQASFQSSHNSSPKTSVPPAESSTTSPSVPSQASNVSGTMAGKPVAQPQTLQQHPALGGLPPITVASGPPTQPPGFAGSSAMTGHPFPASFGPMIPNVSRGPIPESPMFQHQAPFGGNQYRSFMAPNGLPYPPGINALNMMRPIPQGRSGPIEPPSPQVSIVPNSTNHVSQYLPRDTMPSHSHSRQSSASFDRTTFETASIPAQTQPIARPAPIQRPSSVAPHQQGEFNRRNTHVDVDDLSNHLGSSALLEDTDLPLSCNTGTSRRGSMALGGSRPARHGFNGPSAFQDPIGTAKMDNFGRPAPLGDGIGHNWNSAQGPIGGPPLSGPAPWSNTPRPGWPTNNAFGIIGGPSRASGSRAVTIRLLVVQACNKLSAHPPPSSRGVYHNVQEVLRTVELMKPSHEGPISMEEMLEICETEGNNQNGGGLLMVDKHSDAGTYVRFDPGRTASMSIGGSTGPGDIGSPIAGGSMPAFGRMFQQPGF